MVLNYVSTGSKIVLISLGTLVLIGWIFQISWMVQVYPNMIAMVPNTALNFLLLGVALSMPTRSFFTSFLQKIFLFTILTLALLTLLEEFYDYDLGIGSWLPNEWLSDPNPSPGRMAPNTTVAFVLCSLVSLLIPWANRKIIAIAIQVGSVFILLIGMVTLLIYTMNWWFIYDWSSPIRMAAHTAGGFVIASIAIATTWMQRSWYTDFYRGMEDVKIVVITTLILILITLISGIIGIAGLTHLNIKTVTELMQYSLEQRISAFNDTIASTQHDIDVSIKNFLEFTKNSSDLEKNTPLLISDLTNKGFNALQLLNKDNKLIYTNNKFNNNFSIEAPLLSSNYPSYLLWQNGFWFKAKVPIYSSTKKNIVLGYLVADKLLANLTEEQSKYERLGIIGVIELCYPLKNNLAECFPNRVIPNKFSIPLYHKNTPIPLVYAFSGLMGTITTLDNQGNYVVALYSPIGTTGLGMVIKIKANEFFKLIREQQAPLIPMALVLIALGFFLLQLRVVPILRKILSSEKKEHKANLELTIKNREIHLLQELSSSLYSCVNLDDVYALVQRYGKQLISDLSVILYVIHESRNYMEAVASWGKPKLDKKILEAEDCWAIIRGQTNEVADPQSDLICPHSFELGSKTPPFICIPMIANSEAIGIVYLEWSSETKIVLNEHKQKINLATTLSQQIMLAISNIKLRDTLLYQSTRDTLTGLYNRRYLEETLEQELYRLKRDPAPLALLMLDVDHFKYYNDTFGHEAGDKALKSLGQLLNDFVRKGDIACRYGGEEFMVTLQGASREVALSRAQEIHDKVSKLILTHHNQSLGQIKLSIGIAIYPEHGKTIEKLIHNADLALYTAKNQGRNQTVVFDRSFL